jgi:antitoxin component YwqK of YwqJK toxin-antitoxin module
MKSLHLRAFSVISVIVALAGCSSKVLEFGNVKVVNGKLYEAGANEPFSGKVTNVPDWVVLRAQQGLAPVLSPLKQLFLQSNSRYVDAVFFGSSLCDLGFTKGVPDGDMVCKQPQSETMRYQASFSNGALNGQLKLYDLAADNQVALSATFKAGVGDGVEEIYSPKTHKLVYRVSWAQGVASGAEEGFDENSGVLTSRSNYDKGSLDGEVVRYAADGKRVTYHAKVSHGLKDGVEEAFDPETGKPLLYASWANGKKDGPYKAWDADGTALIDKGYANDVEVPGSSKIGDISFGITFDNCVDEWTRAFRRKNGDQAPITADQTKEWRSACRHWNKPPVNF